MLMPFSNFTAVATSPTNVRLAWTVSGPVPDSTLILVNDNQIALLPGTATTYIVDVASNSTNAFAIRAVFSIQQTEPITVTTPAPPVPPPAPAPLRLYWLKGGANNIKLAFKTLPAAQADGYRGVANDGTGEKLAPMLPRMNDIQSTDIPGLKPETLYNVWVRAYKGATVVAESFPVQRVTMRLTTLPKPPFPANPITTPTPYVDIYSWPSRLISNVAEDATRQAFIWTNDGLSAWLCLRNRATGLMSNGALPGIQYKNWGRDFLAWSSTDTLCSVNSYCLKEFNATSLAETYRLNNPTPRWTPKGMIRLANGTMCGLFVNNTERPDFRAELIFALKPAGGTWRTQSVLTAATGGSLIAARGMLAQHPVSGEVVVVIKRDFHSNAEMLRFTESAGALTLVEDARDIFDADGEIPGPSLFVHGGKLWLMICNSTWEMFLMPDGTFQTKWSHASAWQIRADGSISNTVKRIYPERVSDLVPLVRANGELHIITRPVLSNGLDTDWYTHDFNTATGQWGNTCHHLGASYLSSNAATATGLIVAPMADGKIHLWTA